MDLPIKSIKGLKNRRYAKEYASGYTKGYTLAETVIVVGIIALLGGLSTSVYSSFKSHENLEISTIGVVEAVRHAQAKAQAGKSDSNWGAKILPDSVIIFKGTNYSTRDASADQSLGFSGGVVGSGLSEIVFAKVTGSTANTGVVTLTNSYGTNNISINEKGTLKY